MIIYSLYLHFQEHILSFMLVYARLAIVFYMLPVLGERVLSNLTVKNSIIALVIIGLWPCADTTMSSAEEGGFSVIKEVAVGLILAITICLPFWIVIALGEILDNQRGATMSDNIDPVNGSQNSILSSFFNFTFGSIFFASNGMQQLMGVIVQSYHVFPRGGNFVHMHMEQVGQLLVILVKSSLILSAPAILVMMISEVLLGVFARYCPQLNPFSLSMTVKSSIAFIIFLLYGFQSLSEKSFHIITISAFKQILI